MGRTRSDLKEFPDRVQRAVGHDLWGVQKGEIPPSAKLLRGFGSGKVWELRENDSSGTYRAVYTIERTSCRNPTPLGVGLGKIFYSCGKRR